VEHGVVAGSDPMKDRQLLETLESQLEELGTVRQLRQDLEADEKKLLQTVRSRMAEHGLRELRSQTFQARLITQQRLTVDPAALRKKLSADEFLAAVSVKVDAARRLIGEVPLRKISEVSESIQLRIRERQSSRRRNRT
jgi:hypothetical protein